MEICKTVQKIWPHSVFTNWANGCFPNDRWNNCEQTVIFHWKKITELRSFRSLVIFVFTRLPLRRDRKLYVIVIGSRDAENFIKLQFQ